MTHELVVEGLGVIYGRATAVRDVSLVAPGGSITALVGPNGAGKSSTLLAAYGSVRSTGRVAVDGDDVSSLKAAVRARRGVALVPQGRKLFSHLTVRENLQVMAEMLRLGGDAVDAALDRFPILHERVRSLAGVLSGGEQQMLVVTRALMGSPRVLLLDEVVTGLAPMVVQQLARTFQDLAAQGTAVVLAEPNIGALLGRIDRGYVMVRGEVVACEEGGGRAVDHAYQRAIGVDVPPAVEDGPVAGVH
ncbi:ATP-binding cassette domain-containing protein [Iamia majanohamensis]|uniref:ATP-binding cassette domain-containing protein n=1 Tax=Iamia majanohamensis TaxID=467976 RepID=A0AAE9Y777_9ACTN|nr:ATP-binding cassette domain-containing protein [Iamia majanohamensis]WCO67827.1 ATP-binding cassette domain-containing protein [Iamia majanohamensis]